MPPQSDTYSSLDAAVIDEVPNRVPSQVDGGSGGSPAPILPWRRVLLYTLLVQCRASLVGTLLVLAVDTPLRALVVSGRELLSDPLTELLSPLCSTDGWRPHAAADTVLFVILNTVLHATIFYGYTAYSYLVDWFPGKFADGHLVPRNPRLKNKPGLHAESLKRALANHFGSAPFTLAVVYHLVQFGSLTAPRPSFFVCFAHMVASRFVSEFLIYWHHRLSHEVPALYKYHKEHHRFVESKCFSAEHHHPIDSIGVALSTSAYTLCVASRNGFAMWMVGTAWIYYEALEAHSGIAFAKTWRHRLFGLTFSDRAEFHDFHHTHNIGNYGSAFWCDYVFGSMDHYVRHLAKLGRLDANDGWRFDGFTRPFDRHIGNRHNNQNGPAKHTTNESSSLGKTK